MDLVDIGANLSHESFRHDLSEVLARAREAGVAQIVVTGASETESRAAHDIAAAHPDRLFATAGVHPHLAREWNDDTASVIRELAGSPVVVAVGEAGLDFNRDFSPRPIQERVFAAQLEIAVELGMPVFMHEQQHVHAHVHAHGHTGEPLMQRADDTEEALSKRLQASQARLFHLPSAQLSLQPAL